MDVAEEGVPLVPVNVAERQPEPAHRIGVETLPVENLRDVIDRGSIRRAHHSLCVDVAHQTDLALEVVGKRAITAADECVRLDTDAAQGGDTVLGRLGLQLAAGREKRHERHVHRQAVTAADLVTDLPDRLEIRQRLDVADRAAHLSDHDVDVGRRQATDA